MGRQHIRSGAIAVIQKKTGTPLLLPIRPEACRNPDDAQLPSGCPGRRRGISRWWWRFSWGVGGGGFRGGGFGGFRGGGFGGFRGGGFGGFRGGGFGRSADSAGASDVSAVVDSDVVSDSTVGMVGTGVITPTTTDAILSISPGRRFTRSPRRRGRAALLVP
jgi:hypothetical protein